MPRVDITEVLNLADTLHYRSRLASSTLDHPSGIPNRDRRGTTLVELLVIITVITFLLGIVGVVTHTLLRSHRSTQAEIEVRRELARLSLQFREDGHATSAVAGPATGAPDGLELIMTQAGRQTVQYRVLDEPARIQRTVLDAGVATNRDTFRLPPGAVATFEPFDKASPAVLSLVVTWRVGEPPGTAERTRRIETALDLHHHIAGSPVRKRETTE